MRYDVITIGSATQDVFLLTKEWKNGGKVRGEVVHLGSKLDLAGIAFDTGGGATNAAVTFARAGLKVACVTRVGDDPAGFEVRKTLYHMGVDVRHIVVTEKENTGYSTILLTKNGERTVLVYRGASHDFHWSETHWDKIKTLWIYLTSLAGDKEYIEKLMRYARLNKVKVAWNPGKGELMWGLYTLEKFADVVHVLLLNHEEAAQLAEQNEQKKKQIFETFAKSSFPIVVVTDGTHGATVITRNGQLHGPCLGPKAKNATGAGDAFGSAFTAGLIKWNDPAMALRLGLYNSGGVVACMGAKTCIMKRVPALTALKKTRISYGLIRTN